MTTVIRLHKMLDLAISEWTYKQFKRVEKLMTTINETISVWDQRSRDRNELSHLSDRMLQDVGLSRSDVHTEIDKYFWQK